MTVEQQVEIKAEIAGYSFSGQLLLNPVL